LSDFDEKRDQIFGKEPYVNNFLFKSKEAPDSE